MLILQLTNFIQHLRLHLRHLRVYRLLGLTFKILIQILKLNFKLLLHPLLRTFDLLTEVALLVQCILLHSINLQFQSLLLKLHLLQSVLVVLRLSSCLVRVHF